MGLFLTSLLFDGLLGTSLGRCFLGGMILEPVAAAGDRDDLGMVQEPAGTAVADGTSPMSVSSKPIPCLPGDAPMARVSFCVTG